MTRLLTTGDIARIVQHHGLADSFRQLTRYLTEDYRRWQEFDKSARVANHSDEGVIELMPIADATSYSFKYVNGHPKNHRVGLPTVMAFGVLADVATGTPTLLSELTLSTALRTAATSALAAQHLARPDARRMALIGNGAQSEFQALAFHHLLGIDEIRLYDIDTAATEKLIRHLGRVPGLRLVRCASTAEAVRGADIVTTVTADKRNATIITPDMIEPGMHLNAVGGDCPGKTELHRDVLARATVFVEYEPQSRIEGDLQQMPEDFPVTELWRVLRGEVVARRQADEVTVFDSVGFALEDFATLRWLRDQSQALGLGQDLALVPALRDPKDLFDELGLTAGLAGVEPIAAAQGRPGTAVASPVPAKPVAQPA
ncbi:ornithine cyclodeaminase [Roseateles amylovorans]|uniref:Ornithine cyclodeaminase n=1 Tax=Roseateles amylovorans TaxID=2978473 RepID=A0ABY6B410_9BURK|nr:ornithine cyclodeaminase [Roseateles amylovorans]UXH79466.1 ornithine cyclodeaminase [Roseateles amylovorans]